MFQQALRLLQEGRLDQADAWCQRVLAVEPDNALVIHVHALVHRQVGRFEQAEALMRRSVALAPGNPEFLTNLAQLLAARGKMDESCATFESAIAVDGSFRPALLGLVRHAGRIGRFALAEQHARRLIRLNGNDAEAWSALGIALQGQGNSLAATSALERAVALAPGYRAARHQLAAVLCDDERAERALEQIEQAERAGLADPRMMLTRARALVQLDRYDDAEVVLAGVLAAAPFDLECHFLLAQLRHVRGDADFSRSFREVSSRTDAPVAVRSGYADVLRRAGDNEAAEQLLTRLIQEQGPVPALLGSLSTVLQALGRHHEAVDLARRAVDAQPGDTATAEGYVVALLSAGEPRQALPTVEHFRRLAPTDQRWITYRADVARQLGDALFDELCNVKRFVQCYDITPPQGYASLHDFHEALRPALEARHRQTLHPLDQSLRFGTQTSRGLLATGEEVIEALLAAFAEPLAEYQARLGYDPTHPFRSRNRGRANVSGCWSVRLRRGGFHVNHIHPQGWISSAYYVSVPDEVEDNSLRSGWIKFGEPLNSMPCGEAIEFVQPREGRLVLFPSYLWHGTTAIHGDQPRLTVAFDANPAPEAHGS